MDQLVLNRLRQVQAEQDEARQRELMAEYNVELGAHFARHSHDMEELAYDLLNVAWADAAVGDITQQLIEVKTVGLNDRDYIEEDLRGMRAYFQGKGGQILSDIIRYERREMPREEIVAAIDMHVDELETDFFGAFGKLSAHAQEKVRIVPMQRLVELIQASVTASVNSGYYGTFAASSLSAAQVDSVLDPVSIKSGGDVSIVGTLPAIRKLSNIGLDFGDQISAQVFQTGRIATYKAYPVVRVDNFENFEGNFVLPNDELWLVGKRAGRLTYFGAQAKVQQLKLPAFYIRWETARDAGLLLYGASKGRIGRIKLT